MMNFEQMDWQTAVALLIVLMAMAVFVRKLMNSVVGTSAGCGSGCQKCPARPTSSANAHKTIPLVQLESPSQDQDLPG